MATTLPVKISFSLPDGWQAAPPDEVEAPGAAFVALHPATSDEGVTANLTIAGRMRNDSATMWDIAAESVQRLGQAGTVRRAQFPVLSSEPGRPCRRPCSRS